MTTTNARVVAATPPCSMFSTQFWTRSTIYERHEARRSRTLQLRDDQRPTVVRILAGLPGFRTVIPQYVVPAAATGAVVPSSSSATTATPAAEDVPLSSDYYLSTTTVSFHKHSNKADTDVLASKSTPSFGMAAAVAGSTTTAFYYYWAGKQSATAAFVAPPVRCYQTFLLQQGRQRRATIPSAAARATLAVLMIGAWAVSQCRVAAADSSVAPTTKSSVSCSIADCANPDTTTP